MKNYEVELKYTSYVTTSVQADTEDEAIDLAWAELVTGVIKNLMENQTKKDWALVHRQLVDKSKESK